MASSSDRPGSSTSDDADVPSTDENTAAVGSKADEPSTDKASTDEADEASTADAATDEPAVPHRRATKRSARPLRSGSTGSSTDATDRAQNGTAGTSKARPEKGPAKKFVATDSGAPTRRQRMADLQAQQRQADRRRRIGLIGLCVALAVAVLAWPTFKFVQTSIIQATPRNELGVPAAEAGCLPEESHAASGNQEHVPDGTIVPYPRLPPDSGPHYQEWTDFSEKFYTVADRPPVEKLVHNLEHGYVLIWYADTLDDEDTRTLQALVNTYSDNNPSDKVKAAPWSAQNDGGAFPEGTSVILTRWVADPNEPGNVSKQRAVRLACARVSGEVLEQFKAEYPATDSPEPNGG